MFGCWSLCSTQTCERVNALCARVDVGGVGRGVDGHVDRGDAELEV